jgi:hypothetical protein
MKYDKNQHYLIQDEGYPGQAMEDRIFIANPKLLIRKDMRPYDPIKRVLIEKIKPIVPPKETVELQGKKFEVNSDLQETLAGMVEHIKAIESENRALREQASVPDTRSDVNADADGPVEEGKSDDEPKAKPNPPKARTRGKKAPVKPAKE